MRLYEMGGSSLWDYRALNRPFDVALFLSSALESGSSPSPAGTASTTLLVRPTFTPTPLPKRSACAAVSTRLRASQCETMRLGASRGDLARRKENRVSPECVGAYAAVCDVVRLDTQVAEEGLEPPARGL